MLPHMQLMDRNPEFAQLINNPQLLQEAMATSANPVRPRRSSCLGLAVNSDMLQSGLSLQHVSLSGD